MIDAMIIRFINWNLSYLLGTPISCIDLLDLSVLVKGAVVVVIVLKLDLQLPVQSVPITTKIVSLNHIHGEVYSIQHYVIKFVSDLW
jgi:hypothetical protein